MSAVWAPTAPPEETTAASEASSRPVLRGLPRAKARLPRVPFILVLIALFGLGMTGLLMLNTTLQNQAFQVSTLNRQASELAYTQADLESRIDELAAPQELARRASAYGLRPNPYPAFLVLPKGRLVGKPRPVSGFEAPTLIVKTPAELAAERAAAAARKQALAAQRAATAKMEAERAQFVAAQAKRAAADKKVAEAKQAARAKAAATKKSAAAKKVALARQAAVVKKKGSTTQPNGGHG